VSCFDGLDWAALVDSGYPDLKGHEAEVYGLWRYEIRQVALPARGRRALEGRVRHALGIKRHMQPPPRGFARCPLTQAVGGRP
jgi:hypothetical protein